MLIIIISGYTDFMTNILLRGVVMSNPNNPQDQNTNQMQQQPQNPNQGQQQQQNPNQGQQQQQSPNQGQQQHQNPNQGQNFLPRYHLQNTLHTYHYHVSSVS